MRRVRLVLSYDGTDYCGWQKQTAHRHASPLPSLQETLEKALEKILRHPVAISASGRTDAGVHALDQNCHFDTPNQRLPEDLCWALRSLLPPSFVAKKAWIAPEDFHATISSTSKIYRYWLWNSPRSSALLHRYSWWIRRPLDLEKLQAYSNLVVGEHDFSSFRSVGTPVRHSVRQVLNVTWQRRNSQLVEFRVEGTGFLKQMVRNLVGTILDLEVRGQPIESIGEILMAKDRTKAGPAAPPQGLCLARVKYPGNLDKRCVPL